MKTERERYNLVRGQFSWRSIVLATVLLLSFFLQPISVMAQAAATEPGEGASSLYFQPQDDFDSSDEEIVSAASLDGALDTGDLINLIIDTDPGVDDATALAAILALYPHRVDVQAILTVGGNTTPEQGAINTQLIMQQYGLTLDDIPVVVGDNPLQQTRSKTGMFIHGPDGIWWLSALFQPHDEQLLDDATQYYCEQLDFTSAKLLVLGPLTNVAKALDRCPRKFIQDGVALEDKMEIIILGGAKNGGNTKPTAEFNLWQDPEAAKFVFEFAATEPFVPSRLNLTLVPLDAFSRVTFSYDFLDHLAAEDNTIGQFLTAPSLPDGSLLPGPLPLYFDAQTQQDRTLPALIPDVVAAAYTLSDRLASTTPAVVEIVAGDDVSENVRGQSIIALSSDGSLPGTNEQLSMLLDDATQSRAAMAVFSTVPPDYTILENLIGPYLLSPPTNVNVVTHVRPQAIQQALYRLLTVPLPDPDIVTPGDNFGLRFDGVDDHVSADAVPGTGPLTVEAWVQPDDRYAAGLLVVGAEDDDNGWSLELEDGRVRFWLSTDQAWQVAEHRTSLQPGEWYHIAATYEEDNARIFVNGVGGLPATVGELTQGEALTVGGLASFPYFAGVLDEVRVSDVSRYDGDFTVPSAPYVADANTLLLWSFDEENGQLVVDESPAANNGTLGSTIEEGNDDPMRTDGIEFGITASLIIPDMGKSESRDLYLPIAPSDRSEVSR